MNGSKNPPTPTTPSVREASISLLANLDASRRVAEQASGIDLVEKSKAELGEASIFGAAEILRESLRSEYTAMPPIQNGDLALAGIELIKRSAPPGELTPEHIIAVVAAAETAFDAARSFAVRWDSDMRAIERWRAAGEGRELVWPDHADLVVWLLELVELRPDGPSIRDVGNLVADLRKFPASKLFTAAADQLEQMANALIASSRRTVMAETKAIAAERRIQSIPNSVVVSHVPADLGSACDEAIVGDLGAGSRAESFGGDPHGLDNARYPQDWPAGSPMVRVYDSLRFVLGRPDVQEAVAKALADRNGANWQEATEGGRNAFRREAEQLLTAATAAPREG